jgi:hypothetical protein
LFEKKAVAASPPEMNSFPEKLTQAQPGKKCFSSLSKGKIGVNFSTF